MSIRKNKQFVRQWIGHEREGLGILLGIPVNPASRLRNPFSRKSFNLKGFLARPERLELPTYWFEASRSIQLSYGRARVIITVGIIPSPNMPFLGGPS